MATSNFFQCSLLYKLGVVQYLRYTILYFLMQGSFSYHPLLILPLCSNLDC